MHPDLVKLLDLQSRDLVLLDVTSRLDAVLAEIAALDDAVAQAGDAVERAGTTAREAAKRRDELEAKIESYRKMQERRRQKLEFVKGAKEVAALMAELDLARSVLAKEENDWIRSADGVTALEAAVGTAEQALAELREAQKPAREELDGRRAALDAERAEVMVAREQAAALVERTLRLRYDKLRMTRSPNAVVALDGSACGACYTTIPLNRRSQIRAGVLIDWCEACGVILYAAEPVG